MGRSLLLLTVVFMPPFLFAAGEAGAGSPGVGIQAATQTPKQRAAGYSTEG